MEEEHEELSKFYRKALKEMDKSLDELLPEEEEDDEESLWKDVEGECNKSPLSFFSMLEKFVNDNDE